MNKWKVYLSSTYLDLKGDRASIRNYFDTQLKNHFELTDIMEKMYDKGLHKPFLDDCITEVKKCDIYIIILGNKVGSFPPGKTKTYTEFELDTALEEEKKIFSFRLEYFDENKIDNKDKHTQILQKFSGTSIHKFKDLQSLEKEILECLSQFAGEYPINTQNPYKGLASFNIEDGKYFFGRNREIDECLKRIINTKSDVFLSVIGDSGIGKTSFVQAGLLYNFKNKKELGLSTFQEIIVTPGSEPFSNLCYQLKLKGINIDEEVAFHNIVLFFNQFEEVISQGQSTEAVAERIKLFEFLDKLVKRDKTQGRIIVLTSFRSDFLSQLANFDFIKQHQIFFPLSSLDYKVNLTNWQSSLEEIIKLPALINGVSVEAELITQLINETKDVDGSLPILEFGLELFWIKENFNDRKLTLTAYSKVTEGKGLAGLIELHADQVINRITENGIQKEKEAILKSIFINLVEVNENFFDVKRTAKKKELFKELGAYPPATVEMIFEDLVSEKSRLLFVTSSNDGSVNVDIIHEVLIRKWIKIKTWINERRTALEIKKRVIDDIKEFKEGESQLYGYKKIKQLTKWKANNPDLVDNDIEIFLHQFQQKYKTYIKKTVGYSTLLVFILLNLFQTPTISFSKPFETTRYSYFLQQHDTLFEQNFITLNDTIFLANIIEDTMKAELRLIYNPNKKDSIVRSIKLPRGTLYQFSGNHFSSLDSSYSFLTIYTFKQGEFKLIKRIGLPDWVRSRKLLAFAKIYKSTFDNLLYGYYIDFINNKLVLLSAGGIVYFNNYNNPPSEYRFDDTLSYADLISLNSSILINENDFEHHKMFILNNKNEIYQIDESVTDLYKRGVLYYNEGYKNLVYVDNINSKAKIFEPFIPQSASDLNIAKFSIDLPVDFKVNDGLFNPGLVPPNNDDHIYLDNHTGQLLSLVKTQKDLYLWNLQKSSSNRLVGVNSTDFNTYKIYKSNHTVILSSYSNYESGKPFLASFSKDNLEKKDSLELSLISTSEVDSNTIEIIFTDENKNLEIATVNKENLKIQHSHIIFDLGSRPVGNFYWSEDKKYLFYVDGSALYFGSIDSYLHPVGVVPGKTNTITTIFSRNKQLFVSTHDKEYIFNRCINILGANLWSIDWPKVDSKKENY